MKSNNRIVLFNALSTVILQGISFFTAPFFSRILGTENYGIVSVFATWSSIAQIVFSIQAGSTIGNARTEYSLEDQDRFQSSVLSLSVLSYTCCSFLTIVVISILKAVLGLGISFLMVACVLLHGIGGYIIQFYHSKYSFELQVEKNLILSTGTTVLGVVISFILIPMIPRQSNYWGRIAALVIVSLLFGIGICVNCFCKGRMLYNREYWQFTLSISIPTIFHLLSNVILTQSDRVMMQIMVNNEAVGVYSLAVNFAAIMVIIWQALNNSWVPIYYEYMRKESEDEMICHAKNYIVLYTVLLCGFMLLTPEVYRVFAPKEYWGGTRYIILLSVGYYFSFLYGFPANYLFYCKKTRTIAFGSMISAGVNIVLNLVLISRFEILGAVMATVSCYGLQFIIQFISARRIGKTMFPFRLKMFNTSFAMIIVILILAFNYEETIVIRVMLFAALTCYIIVRVLKQKTIF